MGNPHQHPQGQPPRRAHLGEDETRALVRAAIAELGGDDIRMMGRVIGHVMKSGAMVDGGLVSRIAREEFGV